jgi:hypothetical protein
MGLGPSTAWALSRRTRYLSLGQALAEPPHNCRVAPQQIIQDQMVPLKLRAKLLQMPPKPKHAFAVCCHAHFCSLDWMNSSNGKKLDHLHTTTIHILYLYIDLCAIVQEDNCLIDDY